MEEELKYFMVLKDDRFAGFISGDDKEMADEKCKSIDSEYYIAGDYVLKPRR
jgi:hypothetical protein